MSERRKFTKEFKLAAIRPLLDGEKSVTALAEELGIRRTSLQRWVSAFREHGSQAFPGSGKQLDELAEIRRLRRRVSELEMERDILKKAQDFLEKKQP